MKRKIHLIAIGGAAMHNMALALAENPDFEITGSDDEVFEPSRSRLECKGLLPERMGWYPEKVTADLDAVIVGMHARADNPELMRAQELGLKIYSFPEYLYEQTKDKVRVVVGGSHGKTSTTAMILFVLRKLGIEADYMVGAQIAGFDNMVRLSETARVAVFEGDEYLTSPLDLRPKFHLYRPHVAILTGVAWDHINVFPTFENYVWQFARFAELMEPDGKLIYFDGDAELCKIAQGLRTDVTGIPYNTPTARVEDGVTAIWNGTEFVPLQIFGSHNLQNLEAARLVCKELGVSDADFYEAIAQFAGASNRLEKIAETAGAVVYKDFAHSPSKLRATVRAVREQYADRKVVACMELHTFSSLRADFLVQYEGCMDAADVAFVYFNPEVIRHKKLEMITADQVAEAFGKDRVCVFTDSAALQAELRKMDYDDTALLLMTSGNFSGVDLKSFAKELIG